MAVADVAPPSEEALKTKHVFLLILQMLGLVLLSIPCILFELVKAVFPPTKKSLKDQVVLVTGAGRGLGKGLALGFASEGCKVAVMDINRVNAEQTAAEIIKAGGVAKAYVANVAVKKELSELHKCILEDLGPVEILVNNAGLVLFTGSVEDHTEDHVKSSINVNLVSHFWMVQEFLPKMRERNSGHIVAIASMASYSGFANGSVYVATKYGVRGFMEVLREELASTVDNNIKTTTVFPYFINTSADYMKHWDLRIAALSIAEVVEATITAVRRNRETLTVPKYMGVLAQLNWFQPKYLHDFSKRVVYARVRPQADHDV